MSLTVTGSVSARAAEAPIDDLRRMLRAELLKEMAAEATGSLHFATVADEMKLARELLADENMPLGELSPVLDLSDAAAFKQAFELWAALSHKPEGV